MFILRTIKGDGVELNISLGSHYCIAHSRTDEFKEQAKEHKTGPDCHCFLHDAHGETYPLFIGEKYYIMTTDGKTFANLTARAVPACKSEKTIQDVIDDFYYRLKAFIDLNEYAKKSKKEMFETADEIRGAVLDGV